MRFLIAFATAALSASLAAQTPANPAMSSPSPLDARSQALAQELHTLGTLADLSKDLDGSRQVSQAIIDRQIDSLREPAADGAYRWAHLQREEGGRVTEEQGVEKVNTESRLQLATVSAERPYRIEVSVPRKRNLVSDNNRVFVRAAAVDWSTFDGKQTHTDVPINVWIAPGETQSFPLPDIARSAKATVELGVDSGNKKGLAKVTLIQAKLVDDPTSPSYPAVTRLLNIRRLISEDRIRRADLKSAIDEALLTLPGEMERRTAAQSEAARAMRQAAENGQMKGSISLGDATPDVVAELSAVARLSRGNVDEQNEGRSRLEKLIALLSPTTPRQ